MRFSALDGWRGLCALLVAVYHFNTATDFSFSAFIRSSFLFVEFFFVLSGFVICHAYAQSLTDIHSLRCYIIKRIGRLWPLHVLLLLVMVPVAVGQAWLMGGLEERFSVMAFIANLAMVQALGLFATETWNFVSWSISVEFYTCLLFGLVCVLGRPRLALFALVSAVGAVIIYCYSSLEDTVHWAFFRGVYSFFLGCCLCQLFNRYHQPLQPWLTGRSAYCWASVVEVLALAAVIGFLASPMRSQWMFYSPLLFALVVIVYAFEAGLLSRLLKLPLVQRCGLYSYSIYLLHGVLVTVIKGGLLVLEKISGWTLLQDYQDINIIDLGSTPLNLLATLVFVLVLYGLSAASYHYVEKPWRQRFSRWAR